MFTRGDWIVPTFNLKLRTDKPVLLYWLMRGSYSLFGATEFAARLPSALLAIGTSLLTYHLGRRLFRPEVLASGPAWCWPRAGCSRSTAAPPRPTRRWCFALPPALTAFAWSIGGTEAKYRAQGTAYSVLGTNDASVRSRTSASCLLPPANLSVWLLIDVALAFGVLAKDPSVP